MNTVLKASDFLIIFVLCLIAVLLGAVILDLL